MPTARIAVAIAATLPWPPSSPTKRPWAFSARATPAITSAGLRIQWSAALENTASNSEDEVESMAVELADPQAFHARHREQLVAEIDAEHVGAGGLDLGGERPVAAAEIEDALALVFGSSMAKTAPASSCTKRPFRA